jgi:hypothetical protein
MTAVYLSYRHTDSEAAERVEFALTHEALLRGEKIDLWDPRKLNPGSNVGLALEKRLAESDCVILLWSHDASKSRWLFEEANYALEDNKLAICVLDDTPLPARFTRRQIINLKGWNKEVTPTGLM